MTTNHQPPRRISLRALADELNVNHGSLSAAARAGRLVHGVAFDDRGMLIVIDADAAAKNWRAVHVPRFAELCRQVRTQPVRPVPPELAHDAYTAESIAAVLIALHLLDRKIGRKGRAAAAAKLRARLDTEVAAYLVDDSCSAALAYFDQAVKNACEWLDERDQFVAAAPKEPR